MGQSTARRKTRRHKDEPTDVTAIALVAKAIGNLWRASKRADLEQDRDLLIAALQDWQAAHARLGDNAMSLRKAHEALEKAYEALEEVNRTLRKQTTELEDEKSEWRAKFFAAAKELEQLRKGARRGAEDRS